MHIQKSACKRRRLEEDIKRLKLKGYSNRDIAKKVGLTENRVSSILEESLMASKLKLERHNTMAEAKGLPLFKVSNVSTDFSSLSSLGEAIKKYQDKEGT